ncbi:uncharacterized protein H6S33_009235 [Morchella sextelata]|uniref:uncharacterized protein n=1 Tax=Morchella sextelata TaxID=1174677 RepID=UPI001D047E0F|nr:uncharacterized protein H6S33_009235 [Morchella sextelata]KAH0612855.1 hypothetical protein H6S33_009235 [Morchella sextelata]
MKFLIAVCLAVRAAALYIPQPDSNIDTVFNCKTDAMYHPCKIAYDIGHCIEWKYPLNLKDTSCGECSESWKKYTKACVDSGCAQWDSNPLEKCMWRSGARSWNLVGGGGGGVAV